MPGSVERWLQSFMCTQYAHVIESYGYKTLQAVCHLQLPHLLAMGVPRNHSEMIIENVRILRQTMFGRYPNSPESDFQSYRYNPPLNPAVSALKTAAMNANYRGMTQYPEDYSGYNQSGNSMHPMGYHQGRYNSSNMGMMNHAGTGYGVQNYEASHHGHMMMSGQGQVPQHSAMFQQQQQAYMAPQQFYTGGGASSSGGGGSGGGGGSQFGGQQYPLQGATSMQGMVNASPGYYSSAAPPGGGGGNNTGQSPATSMVPPPHHHLRNTSGQQNPQQVADNILQMASSSYPSHHTVPLKNRHAPYQIPRSHFNYSQDKNVAQGQGVSVQSSLGGQQALSGQSMSQQTMTGQTLSAQQAMSGQSMAAQQMIGSGQQAMTGQSLNSQQAVGRSQSGNNLQQQVGVGGQSSMIYPQSSPHSHIGPQASPMSPLMNSPASVQGQQGQSLASPSSLHSPGSTSALRSPAPSPGMCGMRSPCSLSVGTPGGAMRSPVQLPTGFSTQQMSSPPHRSHSSSETPVNTQCAPCVHSPISHVSSPYTPSGQVTHIASPPQPPSYITPNPSPYRLSDSSQGPGHGPGGTVQGQGSSPLQFLQKLVMLPETQVVDPKSVVSEACMGSSSSSESSKNCEGPAEQCSEDVGCSAGNSCTTSPLVDHASPGSGEIQSDEKALSLNASVKSVTDLEKLEVVITVPLMQTHDEMISTHDGSQPSAVTSPSYSVNGAVGFSPSQKFSSNSQASSHSSTSPQLATPSSRNCDTPSSTSPPYNLNPISATGSISRQMHGSSEKKTVKSPHKIQSSHVKCNGTAKQVDAIVDGDKTNSTLCSSNQPLTPHSSHTKDLITNAKQEKHLPSLSKTKKLSSPIAKEQIISEILLSSEEFKQANTVTAECALKVDVNKTKLAMNGFEESEINGNASELDVPRCNHICTRNRSRQNCTDKSLVGSDILDSHEMKKKKVVLNRCQPKHVSRDALSVSSHRVVAAGNSPTQTVVHSQTPCLPSHLSDSEGEREELSDAEVACAFSRISGGGLKRAGSVEDVGPFNDSGSDEEDFSFSDGLDFGYDSPPCEMTGEDSWQLESTKKIASVGQTEGEARCADQGSEKGRSPQNNKSSTGNLDKSTISSSCSRTVTRSTTGRAPKRTFDDTPTNSRRARKTLGTAFNHSNGDLCTKSDKCCIDNDSTDSHTKEKVDEDKDSSPKRNCRKSPVVVLTKAPEKLTHKNKGKKGSSTSRGLKNDKVGKMCTKSDGLSHHSDNHASHMLRGPDGRFLRKTAGIKSRSGTLPAPISQIKDAESDDEPLIVVQRRASKGDSDSSILASTKPISDKLNALKSEQELESSRVNVSLSQSEIPPKLSRMDGDGSFSVKVEPGGGQATPLFQTLTTVNSDLSSRVTSFPSFCDPGTQVVSPSPSKSDSSTPKKRGRPKKPGTSGSKVSKKGKKSKKRELLHWQDTEDDSLQTMKLRRTFHLMQNKKKRSESVPNVSGPFSPFVRVEGKKHTPVRVAVVNHPLTENADPKAGSKKKVTSGIALTASVQISNLPSDKTVMLPSSKTVGETGWTCALCGKRSSYRFLGDLFGPYYLESHLAVLNKSAADASKKDGKQELTGELSLETRSARRKSRCASNGLEVGEVVVTPQEVWVHEDCALWSNGVYLVGSRLYGLEEALKVATATMCASCRETGAMVGCLHKGCNQNFHYACAVDKDCFLDVENFSMLCPKHKDKRLKANAVSTSKS
ncbi:uncharacterized protein LOC112558471 isoform X4 [Pomacea canaliculata]|uniref:uncharacterized protein LOC112558471 isoform X4 n=1 Tax=Pomacea canaliculata TaxID=400727 RepID=UPI000D72C450|nr:uncharacterized protein LOC112558471 isoform X4 [Pomacea canaliculata]